MTDDECDLEHPIERFVLAVLFIAFAFGLVVAVITAPSALAHPGRTDETGCHDVHKDWKGGFTEAKKGTRHCHGAAGTAALSAFQWGPEAEHAIKAEQERQRRLNRPKHGQAP